MLNTDGFVVEASSGNLFWIDEERICTTPLTHGVLPGVTRATILELCQALKVATREANVRQPELQQMQGVFVSLSSFGVVEAESLDGQVLKRSPLTEKIRNAYRKLVDTETSTSL